MTEYTKSKVARKTIAPRQTFDVTCVIGTVEIDDNAPHTAREAAFIILANAGGGVYTFPNEDGTTARVTVE